MVFTHAFLAFVLVPLVDLQRDEQTVAGQIEEARQQRDAMAWLSRRPFRNGE